ncbi:MAG TPA: nitrite reductase small subunit NirD [Bryobacteraceae bacterium]|nr:nitrite reductase small subunit NirD [Bryobacteraceae bacterium]
MPEANWTPITRVENIPPLEGRAVQTGGIELALFNLGDRFAAIENACPHRGGPLCDGIVSGAIVVCPLHGWRFDLATGMAARAPQPACVATFPARVENGIVFVDLKGGRRMASEQDALEGAA